MATLIITPNYEGHYGYYVDIINKNSAEVDVVTHQELTVKKISNGNIEKYIVLNFWNLLKTRPIIYLGVLFYSGKVFQFIYNIDFLYKNRSKDIFIKLLLLILKLSSNVKTFSLVKHNSNLKYGLTYISDPIFLISKSQIDKPQNLNIDIVDNYYLLFGSHDKRKGTFEFLRNFKETTNILVVGKIHDKRIYDYESRDNITIIPEYVNEYTKNYLISRSTALVIPYIDWYGSSGVLGHALLFNKPVVGTGSHFLGIILKKYNRAIIIDTLHPIYHLKEKVANVMNRSSNSSELLNTYYSISKFIKTLEINK